MFYGITSENLDVINLDEVGPLYDPLSLLS